MPDKKEMAYYKNKIKYNQKYTQQNYDQLNFRLPKTGQLTKSVITSAAEESGLSINAYIIAAVREKMERDGFALDTEKAAEGLK